MKILKGWRLIFHRLRQGVLSVSIRKVVSGEIFGQDAPRLR